MGNLLDMDSRLLDGLACGGNGEGNSLGKEYFGDVLDRRNRGLRKERRIP